MRILDRILEQSTTPSIGRLCEYPGCLLTTRDGKPYCPEHVEENPYAKRVTEEIARRKRDDDRARKPKAPISSFNIEGITAQSILQHLGEHGTRTRERLCRELALEFDVLDGYIRALLKKDLIYLGRTHRGNVTLSLRHRPE